MLQNMHKHMHKHITAVRSKLLRHQTCYSYMTSIHDVITL